MDRSIELDELVEKWTLLDDEQELVAGKRGTTRLGFVLLLKFYLQHGQFPRGRSALPDDAVRFVAEQVKVPASELGLYEWAGRTNRYHQAQIREFLGFRECSVQDAEKLTAWLAGEVCEDERRRDRVREQFLIRCRDQRIEPPTSGRVDRVVRSALHQAEVAMTSRIAARLSSSTAERLRSLVAAPEDAGDGGEDGEDSVLALVKSDPGNVSLESMLTEIRKLRVVRGSGFRRACLRMWRLGCWRSGVPGRRWSRRRICALIRRRCSWRCWRRCSVPGSGRLLTPWLIC
ncbi:DUF4158 domain-containing protein [Kribbella sp. NPDC048928]|uniref:DUF4158 domain-containing protein n=1 Tax=Kribbella sp. NPDC048928 TaxID=3364111 RepID=UPI003723BF08